jgi:uncharacterized integral membrane protein (TIGR00697 family)
MSKKLLYSHYEENADQRLNQQFKGYVLLTLLYATLLITAQAMAYRLIQVGPFLEPGGIFIFPATFVVSDIIAEVYGPTLARRSIILSLFVQGIYTILPIAVNHLPYPQTWSHDAAYKLVFDSSWLVFAANVMALLVGMILNTQIIGKTKLAMQGRFFSLRSLFSSAIGEFILTAIIVAVALVHVFGFYVSLRLFCNMFLFKVTFSVLIIYPASILATLFKKIDRIDVYEKNVSLNPFNRFLNSTH